MLPDWPSAYTATDRTFMMADAGTLVATAGEQEQEKEMEKEQEAAEGGKEEAENEELLKQEVENPQKYQEVVIEAEGTEAEKGKTMETKEQEMKEMVEPDDYVELVGDLRKEYVRGKPYPTDTVHSNTQVHPRRWPIGSNSFRVS